MFTVHESIEKRPGHGEGGDEDWRCGFDTEVVGVSSEIQLQALLRMLITFPSLSLTRWVSSSGSIGRWGGVESSKSCEPESRSPWVLSGLFSSSSRGRKPPGGPARWSQRYTRFLYSDHQLLRTLLELRAT
jgi:hypothetical protein